MIVNRQEIERRIRSNYKLFKYPEFMLGEDTRQNDINLFEKSDFKVLIVFLSCGHFRSASNTYNSLNKIIKNYDKNIFVDYCYYPYYEDRDLLKKLELPLIFGNVSHAVVSEYDLVLVNCSIIKEMFNLPIMLYESNIPLSSDERFKREDIPLFVLGGSSANVAYGLFGDINYQSDRGKSLVDLALFGKGEDAIPLLIDGLRNIKDYKKNKEGAIKKLFDLNNLLSKSLYYPNAYNYYYKSDGYSIDRIKVKDEYKNIIPKKVKYNWNCEEEQSFSDKILNIDGSFAKHGDLKISSGCAGSGVCSFCLEGNIGGPWKEESLNKLENDIKELRLNTCPEGLGIFSYNSNYYSDLYSLVGIASKYFDRISLLASRADVYAEEKDYLELVKLLGTVRVSIAAEGVSDRIRNKYLNKNLSKDKFYKAVRNIIENDFLSLKINYILTGKETDEDFEEWIDDLEYFMYLKQKHNSRVKLNITVTNLVIYDQTPLRYEKREMALHSLNYENSEFIKKYTSYLDKISSLGVGITIYGSNLVTCVEQLLLDLGCSGTDILVKASLDYNVKYERDINKNDCKRYIDLVKISYKDITEIFDRRPLDYIFYSDIIEFNTEKNIESYKEMYIKNDYSKLICRSSGSRCSRGQKVCYACRDEYLCRGEKPCRQRGNQKTNNNTNLTDNINDTVTNNPNIHDNTDITNIGTNNTDISTNVNSNKREDGRRINITGGEEERRHYKFLEVKKLIEDNKKIEGNIRLVIERKGLYDYVSPITQTRLAIASLTRYLYNRYKDERYLEIFKYEKGSSLSYISGNELKPYYSGRYVTDIELKYKLNQEIINNIINDLFEINKDFKTFKIKNLFITDGKAFNHSDYNLFVGILKLNNPNDFIERYNKEFIIKDNPIIKTKDIRKSIHLMLKNVKIDKSDIKLYYDWYNGYLIVSLVCKSIISPYLLIKTLYPRMRLEEIYSRCNFSIVGSFRDIKNINLKCFKCGNGNKLYFDLINDKISPMCLSCYAKSYLYNYKKLLNKHDIN